MRNIIVITFLIITNFLFSQEINNSKLFIGLDLSTKSTVTFGIGKIDTNSNIIGIGYSFSEDSGSINLTLGKEYKDFIIAGRVGYSKRIELGVDIGLRVVDILYLTTGYDTFNNMTLGIKFIR